MTPYPERGTTGGRRARWRAVRLRTRMLLAFGLLFVGIQSLTVLALLYGIPLTSYVGEYRAMQDAALRDMAIFADIKKREIADWLRSARDDVARVADNPVTQRAIAAEIDRLRPLLAAGTSPDALRKAARTEPRSAVLLRIMSFVTGRRRGYRTVRIVETATGRVVGSTRFEEVGEVFSRDDAFRKLHDEGLEETQAIRRGPFAGEVLLSTAMVVRRPGKENAGDVVALLMTEIDVKSVAETILHTEELLGATSEIVLVDQDMKVLSPLRFALPGGEKARPLEDTLQAPAAVLAARGNEGIVATFDYRGVPVLAAFRFIRVSIDAGWGMVVKVDRQEVFAPLREKLRVYGIVGAGSVVLVLGMVLSVSRTLTEPLTRLTGVARRLEEGNFAARAPADAPGEVGTLASVVNAMADRVANWRRDLDDRVAARTAELERSNEDLRREIEVRRTAEAAKARLTERLAEKNRELEQIVYVSSHDLRTPLVTIIGFGRELERSLRVVEAALREADLPPERRKSAEEALREEIPLALRYISAGTRKMDALLSGLLKFSRLGRAGLSPRTLDMRRLVTETLASIGFLAKEHGVSVEVEDLPACWGDETQISQVFANLVENGLKYLDPARTGLVRVTGRTEGDRSIYCVEDNGIGIDPDHQEKIFEIFHRLRPEETAGEGLGLAIARKIVRRHGGEIWVESTQGRGSRFFVSLPASEPFNSEGDL